MASLFKSEGRWIVSVHQHGKVSVGKNEAAARIIHQHIQALEDSCNSGVAPHPLVLEWARGCGKKLRRRLIQIKLLDGETKTVGDLADYYLDRRPKRKKLTQSDYAEMNLVDCLGRDRLLDDIRKPDAVKVRQWLATQGRRKPIERNGIKDKSLAPATVSRRFKHIRSMFETAVEFEWIRKNPFSGIKAGTQTNATRQHFVTVADSQKVIDEIPGIEPKLIFALGRWAGMRIPSEPMHLRWDGVNWDRMSLTFYAPKTAHIENKQMRTCPIFPELAPYLNAAWEDASDGAEWVCPVLRACNNPRQWIENIVEGALSRADIKRWPKLFNNLRATRATEIANRFGPANESAWIGHGESTALRHYLMSDVDDVWQRAIGSTDKNIRVEK